MTNFQVGGSEQTAETCVKPQGPTPSTWEKYLRKGLKTISPSVGKLRAHRQQQVTSPVAAGNPLQQNRYLDPSSQVSEQESDFFFPFKSFAERCWIVWVGEMCWQDFHSAGGWAEHHPPFYTVLQGWLAAGSRRRRRIRRRRRRCALPSSAATFSSCCGEDGPKERTGAVTIALPFHSFETYLAKSIFSVMPAVYFALSSYWLKSRICPYGISGPQTPALPATCSIYQATEMYYFSCALFEAALDSPVSVPMEGAGDRYPGPPATLAPAISCTQLMWVDFSRGKVLMQFLSSYRSISQWDCCIKDR